MSWLGRFLFLAFLLHQWRAIWAIPGFNFGWSHHVQAGQMELQVKQ